MIPNLLTIAGSDPSGGAGIQADLKSFAALGTHGMSVITTLTAQNTTGVSAIHDVPATFVREQVDQIFTDIDVHGVKIGMLGDPKTIEVIAAALERHNPAHIVLDPVMISQSGHRLIEAASIDALKKYLIPRATIITPNMPEAEELLGTVYNPDDMIENAKALNQMGARAVLLKGGHGSGSQSIDIFAQGDHTEELTAPRIDTTNNHGTGCTLSSAIAVYLAKGLELPEACRAAKTYITAALQGADQLNVGKGHGPVHHFYDLW